MGILKDRINVIDVSLLRDIALWKNIGKNIVSFIISKGVTFFAPLLFLKVVDLEDYGIVEYSYSSGSVLALVVSLGFINAYPYFVLKKERRDLRNSFLAYGVVVGLISIPVCVLSHVGMIPQKVYFIYLFTCIFALQRLFSSKLKTEEKGHWGVLIDSGYYFILLLVIIVCLLKWTENALQLLKTGMEIYVLCWCGAYTRLFFVKKQYPLSKIFSRDLPEIFKYSYKLIFSGLLIFWLTSSSRIYIGWFMGYEQVGIYSYYFRLAGMSIIIFNFVYIAFFKRLYLADSRRLDLYYTIIIGVVLLACLGCIFIIPSISSWLLPGVDLKDTKLYILLSLQMPVWVAISLCEGLIGRENIVARFNRGLFIIVGCFPVVLYLVKSSLDLPLYAFLCSIVYAVAFTFQCILLKRKKIYLKKCFLLSSLLLSLSIGTYIFV